jgi:hypothetical protein
MAIPAAGAILKMTRQLTEKVAAPGTYFDGSTPAVGGLVPSWTGTANASTSQLRNNLSTDFTYLWSGPANAAQSHQRGTTMHSVGFGGAIAIQSGDWVAGRSKSLRLISVYPTPSSAYSDLLSQADAGLQIGHTYTVALRVRRDRATTGNLGALQYTVYNSAPVVILNTRQVIGDAAGEQDVRITFTVPVGTSAQYLRLYNGQAMGGPDIWADNLMIIEVPDIDHPYTGPYVDGRTPGWQWLGAADGSASIGYPYTLESIAGAPDMWQTEGGTGGTIAPTREITVFAISTVDANGSTIYTIRADSGDAAQRAAYVATNVDSYHGWVSATDTTAGARYPITNNSYKAGRLDLIAIRTSEALLQSSIWVAGGPRGDAALVPLLAPASRIVKTGSAPLLIVYRKALSDAQVTAAMRWIVSRYGIPVTVV